MNTTMNSKKMKKVVTEVIEKLEKLSQVELAAELAWCWGSYQNDKDPSEKSEAALSLFRAAREKNSKAVAKKLVEDLESALA